MKKLIILLLLLVLVILIALAMFILNQRSAQLLAEKKESPERIEDPYKDGFPAILENTVEGDQE